MAGEGRKIYRYPGKIGDSLGKGVNEKLDTCIKK